jgi:hypothetical protein
MTIEAEKAVTVSGWKPMFQVPQWRIRLLHGTLVQVFTQMTGSVLCEHPRYLRRNPLTRCTA